MALRSTLDRFKSISRPRAQTGFSSFANSLVKKQNSAEDAIVDNMYEQGQLSADSYKAELLKRKSRSYTTPLQMVTLDDKIIQVDERLADAEIDRKYQAGQLTTSQILQYEKAKLDKITEPNSVAFQSQSQKVQGLIDKSEKERRTAFRIEANKRISLMPEDNDQRLMAKAQEYQKLAAQARIDGDIQQADVFDTNANNYVQSASRAQINDVITTARQKISQTPDAGLGVPDAEKGAQLIGFTGVQTPAVKNALESLDRSQNTINRLYQSKADKQTLLNAYNQAVNAATGDQKTQLQIALNNLQDEIAGIDNQIGITTQNANDTVTRIDELQTKAAVSAFKLDAKHAKLNFETQEQEIKDKIKSGELSLESYTSLAEDLIERKKQVFEEIVKGFGSLGDDEAESRYNDFHTQTLGEETVLNQVKQNLQDYEFIQADPGKGSRFDVFGKEVLPGQFALTDVGLLKDSGRWNSAYVKKGNAYYKVYYPPEFTDATGELLPQYVAEDLAKLNERVYFYEYKDGKKTKSPAQHLILEDENKKPFVVAVTKNDFEVMKQQDKIQFDEKKGWIKKLPTEKNLLQQGVDLLKNSNLKEDILKLGSANYRKEKGIDEPFIKGQDILSTVKPLFTNSSQLLQDKLVKPATDWFGQALSNYNKNLSPQGVAIRDFVKNIPGNIASAIKGAGNTVGNFVQNLVGGKAFAVPKVEAAYTGKQTGIDALITQKAKKYGIDPRLLKATILTENANLDPNATRFEPHLGESSYGYGQILESTARRMGFTGDAEQLKNPDINLEYTTKYLKAIIDSQKSKGINPTNDTIVREYNSGNPYGTPTAGHLERFNQNYGTVIESVTPTENKVGGFQLPNIVKSAFAAEKTPTPSAQVNPVKPVISPTLTSLPKIDQGTINQVVSKSLPGLSSPTFQPSAQLKPISVPSLPKISQPSFIQNVQKIAAPVVSNVQKAISGVGDWFSKFNPFKKK